MFQSNRMNGEQFLIEVNQPSESERKRIRDEDSLSESNNPDDASGEAQDLNQPQQMKRYNRHTQEQIQVMEEFFKDFPHPDDKQRKELGLQLGLEPLQVKFWFQNKRTQVKTKYERHENSYLRAENEQLRMENMSYKETFINNSCPNCGGPSSLCEMSLNEQHLRLGNARLREEINRMSEIAAEYMGKPMVPYPHLPHSVPFRFGAQPEMGRAMNGARVLPRSISGQFQIEKPMVIEVVVAAMEEFIRMAHFGEPLWIPGDDESTETLRLDEYVRMFPRGFGQRHIGLKSEASRDTTLVFMNHTSLIEILMDANHWSTVFSAIVSKAVTLQVLSTGAAGSYNGAVQVMSAEFHVPSPLVPMRESYFIRYCKQLSDGIWAVVDVSLDTLPPSPVFNCQRRPSGCLIQQMPDGYSKVTWVEHVEIDNEMAIDNIYKLLVTSGFAFGAKRWLATLDRQCERLASVMACNIPVGDVGVIARQDGRKGVLKLAERMVISFCAGVNASIAQQWNDLSVRGSEDVRVMSRKIINDPGRSAGVALNAVTSIWIPVPPKRVFQFLRDENSRKEWDIISNGGVVQEMTHIANGHDSGNYVSLLRVNRANSGQSNMLILQESCIDSWGCFVAYAPVDTDTVNEVLNGGDPDYMAFLPSGFAILPDGPPNPGEGITEIGTGGSLLTASFQILVDSAPSTNLSQEAIATVNSLLTCIVEKIKAAVISGNA
ncbi:homeobox-leucine zipper protein ROC2-like [Tasmannia lanceolata]|uniref:homeobox-leucine zipper protein ROC2-like n=1 Tax=Tasmannia lanceolata TaxID=3420 RepID=UPI00406479B3